MEFAPAQRYPQDIHHGYFYNDRNAPLALTNATRPDPRGYPLGGPVGSTRLRGGTGRDDGAVDGGQARRRIAVACARCRKRKIRCSGDPGNGSGCTNCKSAGVEPSACQFHRVGSDYFPRVVDSIQLAGHLTNMATAHTMMPIYNTNNSLFSRAGPSANPQVDTIKGAYAAPWTVPGSDDTSPLENYSLDQPPGYLPNQGTYGSSYRWTQTGGRSFPENSTAYVEHEPAPLYESNSYPLAQPNVHSTVSEAISPLNMSSLQLSLPVRSSRTTTANLSDQYTPQRQLPIPLPSPAQSSRNVVDQLQDQRLRSAQIMGRQHTGHRSFSKLGLPFHRDGGAQATTTTTETAVVNLVQTTTPETVPSTTDTSMNYLPIAATANEGTQTSLNFSTSALLDAMPTSSASATYSNFRNYDLPTSSSIETMQSLARHDSHTNLYSYTTDPERHSAGGTNALVSGDQYIPLNPEQTHNHQSIDGLQNDHYGARVSTQHASKSDLHSSC